MPSPDNVVSDPEALRGVPVPPAPARSVRWAGVPHGELVDLIRDAASRSGFEARFRSAYLSRRGADLTATFDCGAPEMYAGAPYVPVLGVSSSNRSDHGLRFYCGCRRHEGEGVVVTSLIRDHNWKYRHGFDAGRAVRDAVVLWRYRAARLRDRAGSLSRVRFDPDYALTKLARAAHAKGRGFPWSRIGRVDAEYRLSDSHDAWTFLVTFGRVALLNPPDLQMGQMWGMYKLIVPEGSR